MKYIFFGLLLTNLDLNLNLRNFSIDILPDVIGWVLIILGCAKMAQYSSKFKSCSFLSLIMAAFSLVAVFVGLTGMITAGKLLSIVAGLGDLAFCWFLIKAISDTEDKLRTDLGYMELSKVLMVKVITLALSAVLQFVPYLGAVFIIAHIVVCLIFIYRIYTVMKAFENHFKAEKE